MCWHLLMTVSQKLDYEDPARDVGGFKGSFICKQNTESTTLKVLSRPRHMSRVQCLPLPEPGQQLSGGLSEPLAQVMLLMVAILDGH